jgi:hypothetical protein
MMFPQEVEEQVAWMNEAPNITYLDWGCEKTRILSNSTVLYVRVSTSKKRSNRMNKASIAFIPIYYLDMMYCRLR